MFIDFELHDYKYLSEAIDCFYYFRRNDNRYVKLLVQLDFQALGFHFMIQFCNIRKNYTICS
jgi:hypothetical protein